MQTHPQTPDAKARNVSYILMALALAAVLYFHLLPLLLAVVLTYVFIDKTNGLILWARRRLLPRRRVFQKILTAHNINLVSATLAIGMVCLAIFLLSLGVYHMVQDGHIGVMLGKLAAILEDTKNSKELPSALLNLLPNNTAEIKAQAVGFINEYSAALTRISKNGISNKKGAVFREGVQ